MRFSTSQNGRLMNRQISNILHNATSVNVSYVSFAARHDGPV
jgi:hypothetical protein